MYYIKNDTPVEAFGETKKVVDWLQDIRIHPEVDLYVLISRLNRGDSPEEAICKKVIKTPIAGDSEKRIKRYKEKTAVRLNMFKLAQISNKGNNKQINIHWTKID